MLKSWLNSYHISLIWYLCTQLWMKMKQNIRLRLSMYIFYMVTKTFILAVLLPFIRDFPKKILVLVRNIFAINSFMMAIIILMTRLLSFVRDYCDEKGWEKSVHHHMGFPDDLCFIYRTTQLKVRSYVVDTQPCSSACEVCVIAHVPVGVSGCSFGIAAERTARTFLQDDTYSWCGRQY